MKPAGRAWVIAGVAIAIWAVLGAFYDTSPHLGWLPDYALGASTIAPAAFVLLYTALGLLGGAKWWQNDVGTNIVWLMIADFVDHAFIFWAVLFNHGILNEPWQAWSYVGCQFAAASIVTWRAVIWLRGWRKEPPMLARVRELEAEIAALRAGES